MEKILKQIFLKYLNVFPNSTHDFCLGAIDTFQGTDLAGCQNFPLPWLAWFEVEKLNTPWFEEKKWQGEYIEVYFNNKTTTKLQCDLSSVGFLQGASGNIAMDCDLKDDAVEKIKMNKI